MQQLVTPADPLAAARACADFPIGMSHPATVTTCATGYTARAATLTRLADVLNTSPTGITWCGTAHQAFTASITTPRPMLTATADRYHTYAQALSAYADTTTTLAPRLRTIQADLRTHLTAPPGTTRDTELAYLTAQFRRLHDQWSVAMNTCTTGLRRADTTTTLRDPHGWHTLLHDLQHLTDPITDLTTHPTLANLSRLAGDLATTLGILGIALMFVFPPAGITCLTTATILSGIQTATDITRRTRGEHIPTTTIALDGLSALPILGHTTPETREVVAATRQFAPGTKTVTHLVPGVDGQAHGLSTHEGSGLGHTLQKHVSKSYEYLLARLKNNPRLTAASTFYDRDVAETAISDVIRDKGAEIAAWLNGAGDDLPLAGRSQTPLGWLIPKGSTIAQSEYGLKVVLRRHQGLPLGYFIMTAMVTR